MIKFLKLKEKFEGKPTGGLAPISDINESCKSLAHYLKYNLKDYLKSLYSVGIGTNELHVYLEGCDNSKLIPSEWQDFKVIIHEDFNFLAHSSRG